jgi:hypothetical protein
MSLYAIITTINKKGLTMKTVEELKVETKIAYDNIKVEIDKLQDMVQYKGYEDYSVVANVNWDSVGISIEHKVFNWTNFLTVTIKGADFDFSHGSGGFSNSTVNDRLKATKDMFDIVSLLQADAEKIETQRIVISKLNRILSTIRETYETAEENEALEKAYTELKKTHTEVVGVDILEKIKNGGSVFINYLTYNNGETKVEKVEVENRAIGGARANFYFHDSKYSKSNLLLALETRKFFVEN